MGRLNPNFRRFKDPVKSLSGGQRQSVAIARAIHFNARILIMDEPTAALGPQETAQVGELIKQLKAEGIGIFLISHDIHDVFDLADRVCVMKNGQVVGTARTRRHQGRGARHDHPRQMPARRHSWPGRHGDRRLRCKALANTRRTSLKQRRAKIFCLRARCRIATFCASFDLAGGNRLHCVGPLDR